MNKYETTSIVTINPGARIALSKEQAADRMHKLREIGKGVYEVVGKVQFKIGEKIGYEGELPRTLANIMEEPSAGPTVADLKAKLTAMGATLPAKANKAELEALLAEAETYVADKAAFIAAAEKAKAIKAKALELSELEEADFAALPPAEQGKLLAEAEDALEQE